MHNAGETYAQIAPRCHVAGRPINAKTLSDRYYKYKRRGSVPRVRLEITREDMLEFFARGLTPQAVAVELGVNCGTVMLYEIKTRVLLPRAKKRKEVPAVDKSNYPNSAFLPQELKTLINSRWAA